MVVSGFGRLLWVGVDGGLRGHPFIHLPIYPLVHLNIHPLTGLHLCDKVTTNYPIIRSATGLEQQEMERCVVFLESGPFRIIRKAWSVDVGRNWGA